jgi:phenylalanyl-tRNA synthetase beta chain
LIEVENPLRAEESILRPALLPGLLRAVGFNAARGEPNVALFELGTVFAPPLPGEPLAAERRVLAFARSHEAVRAPHEPNRPVDVYDATSVIDALVQELRLADVRLVAASVEGFHPTRAASVLVDGRPAGVIGQVADSVVETLSLVAPVVVGELDLDALLAGGRAERVAIPISRFPASTVDLAFVVDDGVPAGDIRSTLLRTGGELLEDVALFDVFRAASVGPGKVSLAFALRFRALDRTLTDDEVGRLRQAAIDAVVAEHGAALRG